MTSLRSLFFQNTPITPRLSQDHPQTTPIPFPDHPQTIPRPPADYPRPPQTTPRPPQTTTRPRSDHPQTTPRPPETTPRPASTDTVRAIFSFFKGGRRPQFGPSTFGTHLKQQQIIQFSTSYDTNGAEIVSSHCFNLLAVSHDTNGAEIVSSHWQ